MVEKTVDTFSSLLQRAAVLQRMLDQQTTLPRPDVLAALAVDLAQAAQKLKVDLQAAGQENQALTKECTYLKNRTSMLEQRYRATEQKNMVLQREKLQLEKRHTELKRKHEAITVDRKRYYDLFEFAPDAYLVTDANGKIEEVNQAALALFNLHSQDVIGSRLQAFVAAEDQKLVESLLSHVHRAQDIELCIHPRDFPAFDAAVTLSTVYDETGAPLHFRWLLHDITERRQAMAALNASERRFRAIFDGADLGIALINLHGKLVRANRALQEMLGYSEEELYGKRVEAFTMQDDRPLAQEATRALLANGMRPIRMEKRFCHKEGGVVWVSIIISLLNDEQGQPQYVMGLIENITTEKQTIAELAEMRRRLLESGEVERLRLAQELHDGPMQDLYGAVFRLTNFQDQTCDPEMHANLDEAQTILKQVAGKLRSICGELRPPTIANLGLERAIRSHAERIQENHPDIVVQLHLSSDGQNLSAHTRLAFFRIYQQCIANVLNHSQAKQVMVALNVGETEITLDVWDNGKGFDMPKRWVDLLREGHYGLASVAERVQALGGTMKLETKPGAGTLVHVTAPTEKVQAAA